MGLSLVQKAYFFAKKKHKGQKYNHGSFLQHPIQTAEALRAVARWDENLLAAAYLHDTLEDTDTTYEELVTEFNADIAGLVQEVTKTSWNEFPHLKTQRGVMLKFADRLANISNMQEWPQEKKEKYLFEKSKFWK